MSGGNLNSCILTTLPIKDRYDTLDDSELITFRYFDSDGVTEKSTQQERLTASRLRSHSRWQGIERPTTEDAGDREDQQPAPLRLQGQVQEREEDPDRPRHHGHEREQEVGREEDQDRGQPHPRGRGS